MSSLEHTADEKYPFAALTLSTPVGVQGGAYFSKLRIDGEPLLVQTPKCTTKNGVHTTGKKVYCDLMFDADQDRFLSWLKNLEDRIQELVYDKRDIWFHTEMDYDSIQYHWQNVTRLYKGVNHLLRCFVQKPKGLHAKQVVQIFNEEEEPLTLDDVQSDTQLISILEVTGLRFTSTSFMLEFCLRQIMVLADKPVFDRCLIRAKQRASSAAAPLPSETGLAKAAEGTAATVDATAVEPEGATAELEAPTVDIDAAPAAAEQVCEDEPAPSAEDPPAAGVPVALGEMDQCLEKEPPTSAPTLIGGSDESCSLGGERGLSQVNLKVDAGDEPLTLRKPSEVYIEIYRVARQKARAARRIAIQAYLEAKRIKSAYLLDEMDISSDEDDLDDYSDTSEIAEL